MTVQHDERAILQLAHVGDLASVRSYARNVRTSRASTADSWLRSPPVMPRGDRFFRLVVGEWDEGGEMHLRDVVRVRFRDFFDVDAAHVTEDHDGCSARHQT